MFIGEIVSYKLNIDQISLTLYNYEEIIIKHISPIFITESYK